MAKITITDILSGFASVAGLNANFNLIESEFNDSVLYRNNPEGEPNQMENSLDMNSNDILNANAVDVQVLSINGVNAVPTELAGTEIPAQAGKSGYTLTTNGTVTSWTDDIPTALKDKVIKTYDTLSDMVADTGLLSGNIAHIKGRITINDGGTAQYLILTSVEFGGTPDEIGDHTLSNSNVAALQSNINIQTSTGTSEAAVAIVVGDPTYKPVTIGEGSVLIGGYQEANKNRMPGTRELRAILAGYDNEITAGTGGDDGGLACVITGSHHSEIQGDATHSATYGGSLNIITDGDYNGIMGGTLNEIRNNNGRPTHSGIVVGRGNIVDSANGFIAGSLTSTVEGEFSSIISGQNSLAQGDFTLVYGSSNEAREGTLANGSKNAIFGGRTNIIDSVTNPVSNGIFGGENHETYGSFNHTAGGDTNIQGTPSVNVTYGFLTGLDNTNNSATAGSVTGGRLNESAGDYSTVTGGRESKSTGIYSRAGGHQADATLPGADTIANGQFTAKGDAQSTKQVSKVETTDATPTTTTTLTMADDTTWLFDVLLVARRADVDGESAAYRLTGCVKRDTGAASTALVGTVTKAVIAEDTAAWDADVVVNTSVGGIRLQVTGEASKTIRWVGTVNLTEVTG